MLGGELLEPWGSVGVGGVWFPQLTSSLRMGAGAQLEEGGCSFSDSGGWQCPCHRQETGLRGAWAVAPPAFSAGSVPTLPDATPVPQRALGERAAAPSSHVWSSCHLVSGGDTP